MSSDSTHCRSLMVHWEHNDLLVITLDIYLQLFTIGPFYFLYPFSIHKKSPGNTIFENLSMYHQPSLPDLVFLNSGLNPRKSARRMSSSVYSSSSSLSTSFTGSSDFSEKCNLFLHFDFSSFEIC